jgi:serine/threonine protein kinase
VIDEPGLLLELINPDGKTLKERGVDNARCIDLSRKVEWFEMCVDAVGNLHRMGVAHRDLKNTNFCVTADGRTVKLIDLTMSAPANSDEAGTLCGTEHYWPPDRNNDAVSPLQVDLFALSLIFAEMLLGRVHDVPIVRGIGVPALDHSLRWTLEKAVWRMHGDLGQLSLPKSLVAFARKGTMPNQADRYQTIEQLKAALDWATIDL